MIPHTESSPEVLHAVGPVVKINGSDIRDLAERANSVPRRRIRICMHPGADDSLHEMLIVHQAGCYVRPHRHLNKSESFHIVEGEADVVLLNESADIVEVVQMGDYRSGRHFYYRLAQPLYHTLVIRSPRLIFHEITNGPFRREDTQFLAGTPEIGDEAGGREYLNKLNASIHDFCHA
jgi:cupin fold WbuC family metalloprotein